MGHEGYVSRERADEIWTMLVEQAGGSEGRKQTPCWMGMSAESRRAVVWDAEFAEPEPAPLTAAQLAFERYYQETRGEAAAS